MPRSRLFWTLSWLAAGWIAWEFFYFGQFKLTGAEGSIEGVFLTAGIMGGAIFLHLLGPIGIDPYGDSAVLFKGACFTFAVALFLLWWHRADLPRLPARRPLERAA